MKKKSIRIIDRAKLKSYRNIEKVLEGCGTWAEWIWRSILARRLRCSFTRRFESYSLIFFLAIFFYFFAEEEYLWEKYKNIALFLRERKEIEMEELSWMGSRWLLVKWLGWWQEKHNCYWRMTINFQSIFYFEFNVIFQF